VVERMSFRAYVVFLLIWATLCYDMLAHWVWSGWTEIDAKGNPVARFGWLRGLGALDFAGGCVVHISSGVSSMVAAVIVGRRPDVDAKEKVKPANSAYTLLGGAMLWFGWFGFNSGSALSSSSLAAYAFINTQIATGAAFSTWLFLDIMFKGSASAVGAMSGGVIGLVAITPCAGYIEPAPSLAVGAFASLTCYGAAYVKMKYLPRFFPSYDDSLDAFTAHGIGGMVGSISLGFLATKKANSAVLIEGVFYGGGGRQLGYQLAAVCSTFLVAVVVTSVTLLVLKHTIGLIVDSETAERGLDEAEHGVGDNDDRPLPNKSDTTHTI